MRFKLRDGLTSVEVLIGRRRILAEAAKIEELQRQFDVEPEVTTSVYRAERWSTLSRTVPIALLMRRGGLAYAVVWLSYYRMRGMIVGLVTAGNLCGQGSVAARPADRVPALEIAARIMLRNRLAHTVKLSALLEADAANSSYAPVAGLAGGWHFRPVRLRMDLSGGIDRVMERMSYKMRRNLRYYRRRAEEQIGCRFFPDLTALQRQEAVAALSGKGTYKVSKDDAERTETALRQVPGSFAMGLQDKEGAWISYVAGWREAAGTHIDWQLNHDGHLAASLSTVMRSYLLEHEAQRGCPAIVFVGLTSEFWSRACEPHVCGDLFATRPGLLGQAARWLTHLASPNGQIARLYAEAASSRAGLPPPAEPPEDGRIAAGLL